MDTDNVGNLNLSGTLNRYTGKLRWYVRINKHGLRSEPILQQEVQQNRYADEEPQLEWEDVETVTEKV